LITLPIFAQHTFFDRPLHSLYIFKQLIFYHLYISIYHFLLYIYICVQKCKKKLISYIFCYYRICNIFMVKLQTGLAAYAAWGHLLASERPAQYSLRECCCCCHCFRSVFCGRSRNRSRSYSYSYFRSFCRSSSRTRSNWNDALAPILPSTIQQHQLTIFQWFERRMHLAQRSQQKHRQEAERRRSAR